MSAWISVKDWLPKEGVSVWVFAGGEVSLACLDHGSWVEPVRGSLLPDGNVEAWMAAHIPYRPGVEINVRLGVSVEERLAAKDADWRAAFAMVVRLMAENREFRRRLEVTDEVVERASQAFAESRNRALAGEDIDIRASIRAALAAAIPPAPDEAGGVDSMEGDLLPGDGRRWQLRAAGYGDAVDYIEALERARLPSAGEPGR